jgi:hypothetical protein
MWAAAADMARVHGLHGTAKTLRLDYTRLKKQLGNVPADMTDGQF